MARNQCAVKRTSGLQAIPYICRFWRCVRLRYALVDVRRPHSTDVGAALRKALLLGLALCVMSSR